jgi:hypothetical protein
MHTNATKAATQAEADFNAHRARFELRVLPISIVNLQFPRQRLACDLCRHMSGKGRTLAHSWVIAPRSLRENAHVARPAHANHHLAPVGASEL